MSTTIPFHWCQTCASGLVFISHIIDDTRQRRRRRWCKHQLFWAYSFKVLLTNSFLCWPVACTTMWCCALQVENVQYINSMQIVHRASCTLPTFFMFYDIENTIIIKMQHRGYTHYTWYEFSMYHFM